MSDHLTGFRARLQAGPTAFAAWCAMREPAVAETILKEGFDCAVLDWQHGYHDQASIEAGILIGKWAAATLGEGAATAKIAMLNINKDNISVDVQRNTGFLTGFGIEVPDLTVLASENDPRVIGHESSDANPEGGLRAMETLLAKDPDINVVYTINEPAAEGAFQALKNAGKEGQAIIVSVDGGCPGVASVKSGVIGATSQQYPLKMASLGIEAIAAFAKDGTRPTVTEGLSFYNTGVNLVTDKPVEGVPSIDTTEGANLCWG